VVQAGLVIEQDYLKNKQSDKDWRYGSSGGAPDWQE
jgi:hypothetical protein